MNKRLFSLALLFAVVLSACAAGSARFDGGDPAGFFTGVWHGWIAPIALIWEIFNSDIRVYEPNNSGWAYDAGFYFAIISGFGSLSLQRRAKKSGRPRRRPTRR